MSELPRADYIKAGVFEGDLISREALLKDLKEMKVEGEVFTTAVNFAIEVIDNAPAVEIATKLQPNCNNLQQKGEWINVFDRFSCPFCKMSIKDEVHYLYSKEYRFNYCPNCGAKLRLLSEV